MYDLYVVQLGKVAKWYFQKRSSTPHLIGIFEKVWPGSILYDPFWYQTEKLDSVHPIYVWVKTSSRSPRTKQHQTLISGGQVF